jgi:ABC-type multidrug transport system fused ATPase/permease subunit
VTGNRVHHRNLPLPAQYERRPFCTCRLRLEVEFHNLGLRLRGRKGAWVLAGVTGGMKAARLTAIMGPSGAGVYTDHM